MGISQDSGGSPKHKGGHLWGRRAWKELDCPRYWRLVRQHHREENEVREGDGWIMGVAGQSKHLGFYYKGNGKPLKGIK